MKYWNKDKEVRRRCWTKVQKPPQTPYRIEIGMTGTITRTYATNDDLKRWCQQQDSTGKFYFYYGSDNWWFENPEDAVIFKLKWS